MVTESWVNIGSGNGLLPDGTKPLPELLLTDHQWSPLTFILGQFHKRCLNHQSLKIRLKITYLKFHSNFPGANELSKDLWMWFLLIAWKAISCFINTLRAERNGRHFADFSAAFLWLKMSILTEISLKFLLKGPIGNISALILVIRKQGINWSNVDHVI